MAAGEILDWDTEFFGYKVARIDPLSLKSGRSDQLEGWLQSARPKCAYLLWDDAESAVDTLSTINFKRINTRVELGVEAPYRCSSENTDICTDPPAELLPQMATLSEGMFFHSRFYRDAGFGFEKASRLFSIWAANSFQRENREIFYKLDENSDLEGFLVLASSGESAAIELLGVAGDSRGLGTGRKLVSSALDEAACQGKKRVTVVTQHENNVALKLYMDMGFDVLDSRTWYHAWFDWVE